MVEEVREEAGGQEGFAVAAAVCGEYGRLTGVNWSGRSPKDTAVFRPVANGPALAKF